MHAKVTLSLLSISGTSSNIDAVNTAFGLVKHPRIRNILKYNPKAQQIDETLTRDEVSEVRPSVGL